MAKDCTKELERIRNDRQSRKDYGVKGMKWGEHKNGGESGVNGSGWSRENKPDIGKAKELKEYKSKNGFNPVKAEKLDPETKKKIGDWVKKNPSAGNLNTGKKKPTYATITNNIGKKQDKQWGYLDKNGNFITKPPRVLIRGNK